jgi:hypothetical protein
MQQITQMFGQTIGDTYNRVVIDVTPPPQKTNHVKIENESVRTVQHYIRMVGNSDLLGCILMGPAGMGKTHLVRTTLDEAGVPYKIYGGHITLAGIYEYLCENADSLIFFDDVSQVVSKPEIMEMLKQALNLSSQRRYLNYRSKTKLAPGISPMFEFTGRIIMAFNKMDSMDANVKAIIDRAPLVELKFSYKEIIQACRDIADSSDEMDCKDKNDIVDVIENYTDSSMNVSLRKLFLAFKIFKSFKKLYGDNDVWQEQVRKLFGKKKVSWMKEMVTELGGVVKKNELIKEICIRRNVSPRTALRRVNDFVQIEEIYQNKQKGGVISNAPFN